MHAWRVVLVDTFPVHALTIVQLAVMAPDRAKIGIACPDHGKVESDQGYLRVTSHRTETHLVREHETRIFTSNHAVGRLLAYLGELDIGSGV